MREETNKANRYYKYLLTRYGFANTYDRVFNNISNKTSQQINNVNEQTNENLEILERLLNLEKRDKNIESRLAKAELSLINVEKRIDSTRIELKIDIKDCQIGIKKSEDNILKAINNIGGTSTNNNGIRMESEMKNRMYQMNDPILSAAEYHRSGSQTINNDIMVPNNNQYQYNMQSALSREQYQQMVEFQNYQKTNINHKQSTNHNQNHKKSSGLMNSMSSIFNKVGSSSQSNQ